MKNETSRNPSALNWMSLFLSSVLFKREFNAIESDVVSNSRRAGQEQGGIVENSACL